MSGETILIGQLRAEVERLSSDVRKWRMSFDGQNRYANEQKARAEKAERETERLRSEARMIATEHFAAEYWAAIARADKAEDERDAAIARSEKAERERDDWRSEYENVAKFATQYERERDEARAENERLKAALDSSSALIDGYERDAEQLRAARLRPETVDAAKLALSLRESSMQNIRHLVPKEINNVAAALADLSRAYPKEE